MSAYELSHPSHRDFVQADVLDGDPDNRQATGLRGEHVDLVGALAHEALETFNGVGRLNVSVHGGRKLVKREEMLLLTVWGLTTS